MMIKYIYLRLKDLLYYSSLIFINNFLNIISIIFLFFIITLGVHIFNFVEFVIISISFFIIFSIYMFISNGFKFSKNFMFSCLQKFILFNGFIFLVIIIFYYCGFPLIDSIYCEGTDDNNNQAEASTNEYTEHVSAEEGVENSHFKKGGNIITKAIETIHTVRSLPLQASTALTSYIIEEALDIKTEIERNSEILSKIKNSKESKPDGSIPGPANDVIKSYLEIGEISPLENLNLLTDTFFLNSFLLILFLIFLIISVNFEKISNFVNRLKVWFNNKFGKGTNVND